MKIEAVPLGPFETNAYLVTSDDGKECCVVDAPKGAGALLDEIKERGLRLTHLQRSSKSPPLSGIPGVRKVHHGSGRLRGGGGVQEAPPPPLGSFPHPGFVWAHPSPEQRFRALQTMPSC